MLKRANINIYTYTEARAGRFWQKVAAVLRMLRPTIVVFSPSGCRTGKRRVELSRGHQQQGRSRRKQERSLRS